MKDNAGTDVKVHAGRALADTIGRLAARDGRPVALVVAMYARKDAEGFLAPFAPLSPKVVTTNFHSPNAAAAEDLAAAARAAGLAAETAPDVEQSGSRVSPGDPIARAAVPAKGEE